jgi:hypothetical protein
LSQPSAISILRTSKHDTGFDSREFLMKKTILGLALGAALLIGLQHSAQAAPVTAPASPAELSAAQSSVATPVYVYRRGGYVRGPGGHACAGARRCVGGYYHGVCRSWAACR